jgi:hypothetical protein
MRGSSGHWSNNTWWKGQIISLLITSFKVLTTGMLLYSTNTRLIPRGLCGKQSRVNRGVSTENLGFHLPTIISPIIHIHPSSETVRAVPREPMSVISIHFFLSFLVGSPLPNHCNCRGLLLHMITVSAIQLPQTRDRPAAETSTWQHTALTRDRQLWLRLDSNPQSQQPSGRRPAP